MIYFLFVFIYFLLFSSCITALVHIFTCIYFEVLPMWVLCSLWAVLCCFVLNNDSKRLFCSNSLYLSCLFLQSELPYATWQEVQARIVEIQKEHQICIHKKELTELDIYHRILRFKNYMVSRSEPGNPVSCLIEENLKPLCTLAGCHGKQISTSCALSTSFAGR